MVKKIREMVNLKAVEGISGGIFLGVIPKFTWSV
jgi:hypothetical protein